MVILRQVIIVIVRLVNDQFEVILKSKYLIFSPFDDMHLSDGTSSDEICKQEAKIVDQIERTIWSSIRQAFVVRTPIIITISAR